MLCSHWEASTAVSHPGPRYAVIISELPLVFRGQYFPSEVNRISTYCTGYFGKVSNVFAPIFATQDKCTNLKFLRVGCNAFKNKICCKKRFFKRIRPFSYPMCYTKITVQSVGSKTEDHLVSLQTF